MNDQPAEQTPAEGFSLDIGGVLFHVQASAGFVYTHGYSVHFSVPEKETLELWLAPKYFLSLAAESPPVAVRLVAYDVTCRDGMACIRVHAPDKDGNPAVLRRRMRDGRISLSFETKDPGSARVCLELAGEGAFDVRRFALSVRSSVPVELLQHNPLLELVMDDFRSAEKAGAALPHVTADSILTYRASG